MTAKGTGKCEITSELSIVEDSKLEISALPYEIDGNQVKIFKTDTDIVNVLATSSCSSIPLKTKVSIVGGSGLINIKYKNAVLSNGQNVINFDISNKNFDNHSVMPIFNGVNSFDVVGLLNIDECDSSGDYSTLNKNGSEYNIIVNY